MIDDRLGGAVILALVLGPSLAATTVRFMGPQSASASQTQPGEASDLGAVKPESWGQTIHSPNEMVFATYVEHIRNTAAVPSPFEMGQIVGQDNDRPQRVLRVDMPVEVHPPRLVLTAVLPNARRPLAVINGTARMLGSELGGGWTVVGIDGPSRSVSIEHKSGASARLRMSGND